MFHHILVPVAFDTEHEPEGALRATRSLLAPGGRVTLLHVMEEVPMFAIYHLPDDDRRTIADAILAELERMAETLPDGRAEVVDGESGHTIIEWARENEPDCIILASQRPGRQNLLMGSTADYVVRHAQCSVLVLR